MLSVDDEIAAANLMTPERWVARGRWGLALMQRVLFPDAMIPVMPLMSSLLCLALGAAVLCQVWGVHQPVEAAALAALIASVPVLSSILVFNRWRLLLARDFSCSVWQRLF